MNPDTYIAPVFSRFLDWAQRHANYVISASRYVEDVKRKKTLLEATKADLNIKIEDARRRLQVPSNQNQVVVWQGEVDAIIPKIDEVVQKYETRACVRAICSNHKTGHCCDYKIKEVDALLIQGSQYLQEEMVACPNPIVPIPQSDVVPGSLDSNFTKVLNYIEDDKSKINVIGIWGTGGVGKTTLLTKIYNSCVANKATFQTVIWIVASKDQSNVAMIQQKIVEKLGLAKKDDVQSQAHIIHSCLMDQNLLLFIDDLWEAVEFAQVGVPNPNECGKRRKVIFTTRSRDVCGNMEAKETIKVDCLNWEDSWSLFKEKVGDRVLSDARIYEIAKGVAIECKGLPLALKTIGRAMSQKKTFNEWKSALDFMKKSQVHNVPGIKDEMQHVLKLSYDYLDDDALKRCFLTISMWPEDFIVPKDDLIECWMGLDIIDNFENIEEAYQNGHSLIERLLAAALLEDGDDVWNNLGVKMHDVIRDLALWIASDCGKNKNKWLVKAGFQLQEAPSIEVKWSEAEYISLMRNRIKELPSSSIPSCPHLLTLVLQSNLLTCESILSSFHKFQSLKYLNLSHNLLQGNFLESICYLTDLQYLNLAYNHINSISENLRNLKKLKYLILRGNPIYGIPREVFSELGKLLVLDLIDLLFVNPEVLKCSLKKLLYLGISVVAWGDDIFKQLLNMSDLNIVALQIYHLHIKSCNFMSRIPNPYCLRELFIGSSDDLLEILFEANDIHEDLQSITLKRLELCYLPKLERIIWKRIEPKKLFAELQMIDITNCNLNDISWVIHLPSLIHLKICMGNKNMRIAINNENNDNILTFPSLKTLMFVDMRNLEKISTCSLAFPELHRLSIEGCPLLKTLPIEIESTPKLLQIRGEKDWWDNLEWKDDDSRSQFSQLFSQDNYMLRIRGLPLHKSFFLYK